MEWEDFRTRVDVQALRQVKTKEDLVRLLRPAFPEFSDRGDSDLLALAGRYVPEIHFLLSRME